MVQQTSCRKPQTVWGGESSPAIKGNDINSTTLQKKVS